MNPYDWSFGGFRMAIWDVTFILAVIAAYPVYQQSFRFFELRLRLLRYIVIVYLSALAAQLFARSFDASGSLVPPESVSLAAWYLSPIGGPKTLYGVIVMMPLSVSVGMAGTNLTSRQALDLSTPALLLVLAIARLGCFLQGCCFGAVSTAFGVAFPIGSPVYFHQLEHSMIAAGAMPKPVVPTQLLEAMFLGALLAWMLSGSRFVTEYGRFLVAVASYSVFRFVIEFVRADPERGIYGPLATSQWIALVVLGVACAQVLTSRSSRTLS